MSNEITTHPPVNSEIEPLNQTNFTILSHVLQIPLYNELAFWRRNNLKEVKFKQINSGNWQGD